MNGKACLAAAWVALVVVGGARGQFTPGHVFVTDPTSKRCTDPEFYTWDRIWEIDPRTGEVTLFAELEDELCGFVWGAAFTPDGKRLRVAQKQTHRVLEFDSAGNVSVVLDVDDGLSGPRAIVYDADGNFYVSNGENSTILRFPATGDPGIVLADRSDGINGNGPMTIAADGDLYFGNEVFGSRDVLRITPDGEVSVFDSYEINVRAVTLTADAAGFLYIGLTDRNVYRYVAGDPESKELLASDVSPRAGYVITMSPDQESIYVTYVTAVRSVDLSDGGITHVADLSVAFATLGVAFAPPQFIPVPSASEWGIIGMTLCLLTVGTLALARRSRAAYVANPPLASSKQFRGRSECASGLQPDLQLGFRARLGVQD